MCTGLSPALRRHLFAVDDEELIVDAVDAR